MTTMLPALPTTFGRLTDVFVSALGSITGSDNRLSFASARRVCVVLVDGLGSANLKAAGGHAKFLNAAMAKTKPISCGFPSTTATSLASFATGLRAGEHQLVGYQLFDRELGLPNNLLTGWGPNQQPLEWQPNQTVSQRAIAAGIAAYVIGPAEYEGSGFTQVTMREAKYLGEKSISDRVLRARELLNGKTDCLIYLYVPELDQTAHAFGAGSDRWLHRLEELDSAIAQLARDLSKQAAVALTADHGIVDVPHSRHIYVDEFFGESNEVRYVGGDPRVNYLYLEDATARSNLAKRLQLELSDQAWVLTREEAKPLFSSMTPEVESKLPEVFILARKQVALYDRRFAKPQSLKMIGQHGSITIDELSVPLLGWGEYA